MTEQKSGPALLSPVELAGKIDRLSQILEFENELIANGNPQGMSDQQSEKSRLVAIYNQQMTLIKADPDRFKMFPQADIDALRASSTRFYDILDAHFRKLSTAKTVTEGLVKAVADEAARKKAPPKTYNAAAGFAAGHTTRNNSALSSAIAVNQVI
ncbi:hypothetical protein [Sneathiella chinensis]|uniref:Flagellar basal-body protein FlbY n=1 Tax=Sneathiella chinensis TaxID=349750 RepID=A0ABQ5U5H6_9PROT|nr:hypothetical protein [Sneathiella chinensis]GLQ07412.1 hypothetical protein GCM10007924_26330 [Sneathiella chinensis]